MKRYIKKATPVAIFATIWAVLFFCGRYMLYLQEQMQLFQNEWNYFIDNCQYNAGFAQMVSEFFVQFYHLPWLGTMLMAFVITTTIYAFKSILIKAGATKGIMPMATTPAIPLIYSLITSECTFSMIQFAIAIWGSALIVQIPSKWRTVVTTVTAPFLFWLCGAPAILLPLFTIIIAINEKCTFKNIAINIIPLIAYLIFGYIGIRVGFIGSFDHFLNHTLHKMTLKTLRDPQPMVMVGWSSAIIIVTLIPILKRVRFSEEQWFNYASQLIILLIMGAVVWCGPDKTYTTGVTIKEYNLWGKLHYLYTQGRYQELLDMYQESAPKGIIESNYINLALYREGRLLDDFFKYSPVGHTSLLTRWADAPFPIAFLWGEVNSEMGYIAKSGQTAYEGNVLSGPRGSSMFTKILVESEIIMRNYKVAEKYITALENTIFYKEWATAQRAFLSDQAVAQNEYYSSKRKCIMKGNQVMALTDELKLMQAIIRTNPKHKSTFNFASLMTLSAGVIPAFREVITSGVESRNFMPPYHKTIQEGIVAAYNQYPVFWNFYKVNTSTQNDYKEFAEALKTRNANPMSTNAIISKNQHRYWFYIETLKQRVEQQQKQGQSTMENLPQNERPNN